MKLRQAGLFILIALLATSVQARIFDITKENFASYLLFNASPGTLDKSPYEKESGSNVSFDQAYGLNYGGEFGFLYATPAVNLRFGLEIIKPGTMTDVKATSGSTDLYTMKSDIVGFAPKLGVEINLKRMPNYRLFFLMSAGSATITMKNDYVLTTAAKATYGVTDHSIDVKGTAMLYSASLGGEITMTDTTTFVAEAGYRSVKFDNLTYNKSVETFTGTKSAGDPVVDSSGNKRSLDFSGAIFTVGFRFYL